MTGRIRAELEAKRKELERKNNLRSLEIINWIDELLKKLNIPQEPQVEEAPKEVVVELPEREEPEEPEETEVKKPAKKKIQFKKK